jgi:uncharacterized membrane protein YedE/YeeE
MLVVAIVLGCILGFAAHRASVCTVRAVAELMSARSANMFAGVGRSWLWIWAVTIPFLWLMPAAATGINGWALTGLALLGGLAFGFGAALNGACAYSTMARLADGEGAMLAAVAGFAAGTGVFAAFAERQWLPRPMNAPVMLNVIAPWALVLAILFVLWAIYEGLRLWRTREPGLSLRELVLARRYRLSTAAMLMGVSGALLFLMYGSFGYTATFELLIERALGTGVPPPPTRWMLLIAVLAGMVISTLLRRSFRLDLRPRRGWLMNFGGGMLMGFGTALAPGGNDALVMYGIPTLSPYALPTYLALGVGVAAGLMLLRALAGFQPKAEFRDDVFIADSWTRPLPSDAMPPASPHG